MSNSQSLDKPIIKLLETLGNAEIMVEEFQSQEALNIQINSIVKNLEEIFDASQNLQNEEQSSENIDIPHDLLEFVDQGKNPDLYLAHLIDQSRNANLVTRSKVDTFREFRETLSKEMQKK